MVVQIQSAAIPTEEIMQKMSAKRLERTREIGYNIDRKDWLWVGEDKAKTITSALTGWGKGPYEMNIARSRDELFLSVHIEGTDSTRYFIFTCNKELISDRDIFDLIEVSRFSQTIAKSIYAIWYDETLNTEAITVVISVITRYLKKLTWEDLQEEFSKRRRQYRKAAERPAPDEPADSDANREKVRLTVRLSQDEARMLDDQRRDTDRNTWIRKLITSFSDPGP